MSRWKDGSRGVWETKDMARRVCAGVHLGGYVTKTSEGMSAVPKRQVLFLGTFVALKIFSKII